MRGGKEAVRLKVDICFVYVARCQDAAIFDESKTAFLAPTPLERWLPGKGQLFFSPVYMQVT